MQKTLEVQHVEETLYLLGRSQKLELLESSNLNDRELNLLINRFVKGLSLKECSEELGLEINTVSKNQQKAIKKLYLFLHT